MSAFQRRGTVSKPSGPVHVNSYALKGVPIKYQPPIFVPDLIRLPADWKAPTLPSHSSFGYDYSKERWVLEQSRVRTLSFIAEAEASELKTQETQRQQQEDETENSQTVTPPQPLPRPPIFSSTILTPTQVTASPSSNATPTSEPSAEPEHGGSTIKSLGQLSIREFEGDDSDPFELATLKAINDMEILQSVLQPTAPVLVCPATATVTPPSKTNSSSALTQTSSIVSPVVQTVPPGSVAIPATTHVPVAHSRAQTQPQVSPPVAMSTDLFGTTPTPTSTPSPALLPQPFLQENLHTNPFYSAPIFVPTVTCSTGLTSTTTTHLTNPFSRAPPLPPVGPVGGISPTNPFLPREPASTSPPVAVVGGAGGGATSQEPGVGLLIDIDTVVHPQPPVAPAPVSSQTSPGAIPQLPPSYSSVVGHPVSPRANLQAGPSPTTGPVLPNGPAHLVHGFSTVPTSPPVPPKPQLRPQGVAISQDSLPRRGSNPLPLPPKGIRVVAPSTSVPSVQARANALLANLPPISNRPGLGVSVLPPIVHPTTSASSHVPAIPSPPIPAARRHTPPPPYYHDQPPPEAPRPAPRPQVYRLPDPQANLSSKEVAEVDSISGMGFPAPRVARAVLRFGTQERSTVLDFLIQVGRLEEEGYNGDSAETALLANEQSYEEALTYLQKVSGYQSMGFPEKAIHEACEKAEGDWDNVLDILTQES